VELLFCTESEMWGFVSYLVLTERRRKVSNYLFLLGSNRLPAATALLIIEAQVPAADSSCGEFARFKSAKGRTRCGELRAHFLDCDACSFKPTVSASIPFCCCYPCYPSFVLPTFTDHLFQLEGSAAYNLSVD
jgi:hypothetical protein